MSITSIECHCLSASEAGGKIYMHRKHNLSWHIHMSVSQSVDYELHHTNYQVGEVILHPVAHQSQSQSVIQSIGRRSVVARGLIYSHSTCGDILSPCFDSASFSMLGDQEPRARIWITKPRSCPETNWCISSLQHFSSLHLVSNRSIRQRSTMSLDVAVKSFVHPSDGRARWQQDERRTVDESPPRSRRGFKNYSPHKTVTHCPAVTCGTIERFVSSSGSLL